MPAARLPCSMASPRAQPTDAPAAPRRWRARRRSPAAGGAALSPIVNSRASLRNHHRMERSSSAGSKPARPPSSSPSIPRPPASTTAKAEHRRRFVRHRAGQGRLPAAEATDYPGAPDQLDREQVLAAAEATGSEDPDTRGKVGHHLKYDAHVLGNHGTRACRHAPRLHARVLRAATAWPRATTWIQHGQALPGRRHHHLRGRWPARARSRSAFEPGACGRRGSAYAAEDADVDAAGCTRRCGRSCTVRAASSRRCTNRSSSRWSPGTAGDGTAPACSLDAARCGKRRAASWAPGSTELQSASAHVAAGRRVQPRFAQAAATDPVREKLQILVIAQDADGPAVHGRGRARGAGRRAFVLPRLILEYRGLAKLKSTYTDKPPWSRSTASAPGASTRRTTRLSRRRGACPRRIRTCRTSRSASARRPAHPAGLHRAARPRAAGRGLLADRAAQSWRICPATQAC